MDDVSRAVSMKLVRWGQEGRPAGMFPLQLPRSCSVDSDVEASILVLASLYICCTVVTESCRTHICQGTAFLYEVSEWKCL